MKCDIQPGAFWCVWGGTQAPISSPPPITHYTPSQLHTSTHTLSISEWRNESCCTVGASASRLTTITTAAPLPL